MGRRKKPVEMIRANLKRPGVIGLTQRGSESGVFDFAFPEEARG